MSLVYPRFAFRFVLIGLIAAPATVNGQDVIVVEEGLSGRIIQSKGASPFQPPPGVVPSAPPSSSWNAAQGGKPSKKPDAKKTAPGKDGKKETKDGKQPNEKKGDTTTRPDKPAEPADPNELKVRPDDDGKVSFQFRGQAGPDVLEWLADISQMSLDWQELPNDYLNLTTRRRYTVEETRDLINQRLLTRGYTILMQAEGFTVVKVEKLNPAQVPRVKPEELEARQPHDFAKDSFDMQWLIATDAVKELETLKSAQGKLIPMPGANHIEALDTVLNLREIYNAIQE